MDDVEKGARALCRLRIAENIDREQRMGLKGREPKTPEFIQRAEDYGWKDFVDQSRAVIEAIR